jgi:hypothetical protein
MFLLVFDETLVGLPLLAYCVEVFVIYLGGWERGLVVVSTAEAME